MKNRKTAIAILALLAIVTIVTLCNPGPPKTEGNDGTSITPVELPSTIPGLNGFHFPEDSNVIYSWLNNTSMPNNYDSASVYQHVWGIWAGLTQPSGQVYQGDSLLIFETWLGITDIRNLILSGGSGCGSAAIKKTRAQLHVPHQFEHGSDPVRLAALRKVPGTAISNPVDFWVTVSYDPNAACYATNNQILKRSVVEKYRVKGGIGSIPKFPQKAVTIKPTYFVGEQKDGLIRIPVWPGPPSTPQASPFTSWNAIVYADVNNKQQPNKKVIPADTSDTDPARIAAATCNLSDFINFRIDSAMAAYMNASDSTEGLTNAQAGQVAILVAMHVTTKEISNWTWQSYYWDPNPDMPYAPSSKLAAKLKPALLRGAASHYSATSAYAMVLPNQPIAGGTNKGAIPMLGYNPYLEAGFAGLGPITDKNVDFNIPSLLIPGPPFGIQTNCMTCHSLATMESLIGYSSDQYISMDSSIFKDKIQIDFAWSIQGNLIQDK